MPTLFCSPRNVCRVAVLASIVVLLSATGGYSQGNAWPQFLGPDRNGISTETGLLKQWPVGGPKEVWRVPGGVGMAGLAIQEDLLVTTVQTTKSQFVLGLSAASGKEKWNHWTQCSSFTVQEK